MTDMGENPQIEIDTSNIIRDYLLTFVKCDNTANTTVFCAGFDAIATDGVRFLSSGRIYQCKTLMLTLHAERPLRHFQILVLINISVILRLSCTQLRY
ncbi:hypothetical protein BKA67DRAFT_320025 [Truncatella angustata]|uniref:Uncharacterized protein n=1 Tax=Truncatella angustata TaxID=152316 RepID=A0A9P8UJT2_9PEZI|nr:uncharacterized protein BKA67DRAFT_320025 [Truncatella angustata]KAH6653399.1 hypothetical protein BKA67DRAFT_320025 [Truncatella angustata]